MMDSTQLREDLGKVLQQETETAAQLLDALHRERNALGSRELEATEEMAREKEALITRLESLASQQQELLASAGVDPSHQNVDVALKALGLASLAKQWQELLSVLAECRHQNLINGGIIEISRRFAQQVLDTLHGGKFEDELYGPEGEAKRKSKGDGPIATA